MNEEIKATETEAQKEERERIEAIDALAKELKEAGPKLKYFVFGCYPEGEIRGVWGLSTVELLGLIELFKKKVLDGEFSKEKIKMREILDTIISAMQKEEMDKSEIH